MPGTVLEQLVSFTFIIWGEWKREREFCSIFHCQYFGKEKDVMDSFTVRKWDIYSQIFRLKLEKYGKKKKSYMSASSLFELLNVTNGYLKLGPSIHKNLIIHTDQIPDDLPWLKGLINLSCSFLFLPHGSEFVSLHQTGICSSSVCAVCSDAFR